MGVRALARFAYYFAISLDGSRRRQVYRAILCACIVHRNMFLPMFLWKCFAILVTLLQGETCQQTEASDMQSRECHECVFGYTVIPLLCVMVMPSCITRFSADAWPMPCLAVVESITTCLNGTDTLPIRQADLHFVAKLNKGSVMHCLHAFARGEQRFGK